MVEDKENYYHPLYVSVKAHLACHSNPLVHVLLALCE